MPATVALTTVEVERPGAAFLRDPIRRTEARLRLLAEAEAVHDQRRRVERSVRPPCSTAEGRRIDADLRRLPLSDAEVDAELRGLHNLGFAQCTARASPTRVFGLRGATVCSYGLRGATVCSYGLRGATVCSYGLKEYIAFGRGVGCVEHFAAGAFDHLLRGDVVATAKTTSTTCSPGPATARCGYGPTSLG